MPDLFIPITMIGVIESIFHSIFFEGCSDWAIYFWFKQHLIFKDMELIAGQKQEKGPHYYSENNNR